MRHTARISRLERTTRASAEEQRTARSDAEFRRIADLIMTDPVAHGLFARIVALTPDAFGNPSFDFVKAIQERPGLAEAADELGQRIVAKFSTPPC